MSFDGENLMNLLPALYRLRDAQVAQLNNLPSGPLQNLLGVVAEQLAVMENDLEQLYDDQFIETCATWVIPYIGDLIGYEAIYGIAPSVANPRAEVANTIALRRRKGTVSVLEELARDVTGWGSHVVEFFEVVATTQYMKHVRLFNEDNPNLRPAYVRDRMDTGFDQTPHTIDVRRIAIGRGRYNVKNIGVFLWSLNAYSRSMADAVSETPKCYRFDPLGQDVPLFYNALPIPEDSMARSKPDNVPDYLRRTALAWDLQQANQVYYGASNSLAIYVGGHLREASEVLVADLPDNFWHTFTMNPPYTVAVDPQRGRMVFAAKPSGKVRTLFNVGFNGDMGGGEYSRESTFAAPPAMSVIRVSSTSGDIQTALNSLAGNGVVEVTDSGTFSLPSGLSVAVSQGGLIELRARDGCRPVLNIGGPITVTGDSDSTFNLNGFVVTSASKPVKKFPALLYVPASRGNALSNINVIHCTLVPGWAVNPDGTPTQPGACGLRVELPSVNSAIQRTILGPIQVIDTSPVSIVDSIIDASNGSNMAYSALDGSSGGGDLTIQQSTVIGNVHVGLMSLASDSIFWAAPNKKNNPPLWCDRRQQGCVRFSYLPANSITPMPYHCVIEAVGTPGPLFQNLRYGTPGYCKLFPQTDNVVRRGADDGAEMGAFHFVFAPMRESDLLVRLGEFMPVGLEFGIFYET